MSTFNGNVAAAEWDATQHPRGAQGKFTTKSLSEPEVSLGSHSSLRENVESQVPLVVESPVGDRDRNFWVKLEPGQEMRFDISADGVGAPGRPYTDDQLTLTPLPDGRVQSAFVVSDDDIGAEVGFALNDLDEETSAELRSLIETDVQRHTGGRVEVVFVDDGVQLVHRAEHEVDSDGGVYTANVFGELESDPSYLYVRDGYFLPTFSAALVAFGYDG